MNNPSQQRYINSIGEMLAVVNQIYKTPGLNRGVLITMLNTFYFQRKR